MTKKHYLLLKTHNKTGLKYLCYTTKADPEKYPGSGKRWRNHLRTHGKDLSTEILGAFDNEEQLKALGRHYSELWNVVDSDEFANLRIEEGDGGDTSSFIDYSNMRPMPKGKWKRPDLTEYNKNRENPLKKYLTCPWCGEVGYGQEFKKKHLVTTTKTKTDPKRFNCPQNPHRILNYNEKLFLIDGQKLTINDIIQKYNLPRTTITNRIVRGWTMERIVSTPRREASLFNYENEQLSVEEIAIKMGVSKNTVRRWIDRKIDLGICKKRIDAIRSGLNLECDICKIKITGIKQIHLHFENCEENLIKKEATQKKYKFDNQELTINKIGARVRINPNTLQDRLNKGKTLEEAIKMGVSQKDKNLDLNGKKYTVSEFLTEFQIASTTFYRNKKKYSLEELIKKFSKI